MDRQLKPPRDKSRDKNASAITDDNNAFTFQLKNFILESVTLLIECVENKKEEAGILRSLYSKYEDFEDGFKEIEKVFENKMQLFVVEKTAELETKQKQDL